MGQLNVTRTLLLILKRNKKLYVGILLPSLSLLIPNLRLTLLFNFVAGFSFHVKDYVRT